MLTEIIAMLRAVTGADQVTAASRLEQDLHLDSLELAAFGERLGSVYGADLAAFLAGLDIDQLIALTVADVAGYMTEVRGQSGVTAR